MVLYKVIWDGAIGANWVHINTQIVNVTLTNVAKVYVTV